MVTETKESQAADVNNSISLTSDQLSKFQTAIKIGLYKELHSKGLLTDTQLKQLMSLQNM